MEFLCRGGKKSFFRMRNKKPCGRLTTVVVIPTRVTKIIPTENFPNEKYSM